MESTQSVHGRITYRRVEAVIDAKIKSLNHAKQYHPLDRPSSDAIDFAISTLSAVSRELNWRDLIQTWPPPL